MSTSASFPTSYTVGSIRIEPNLVLSPMEGITDLPFRRLIRRIGGAGLTVTEFVASAGLRVGARKMVRMACFDPDERPVAVQLYGRDPTVMAEAARIVEDMGATICDINMGCPSKKVCAHSGGSALMKEPLLAAAIVREVRRAVQIPVTVKMRSGFDHDQRNAPEVAEACVAEGADAIAIHWRTRRDGYKGTRQVDKIAETKRRVDVPVLANGDIIDIASARRMFEETGCDGLLIGRGAIRNPWLMLQIAQDLRGEVPRPVSVAEQRRVLFEYLEALQGEISNPRYVLGKFKQIAKHFIHGLPDDRERVREILRSQSIDVMTERTDAYFRCLEALLQRAPAAV